MTSRKRRFPQEIFEFKTELSKKTIVQFFSENFPVLKSYPVHNPATGNSFARYWISGCPVYR